MLTLEANLSAGNCEKSIESATGLSSLDVLAIAMAGAMFAAADLDDALACADVWRLGGLGGESFAAGHRQAGRPEKPAAATRCELCDEESAEVQTCDLCGRHVCRGCRDVVTYFLPDDQPNAMRGERLLCLDCAGDELEGRS